MHGLAGGSLDTGTKHIAPSPPIPNGAHDLSKVSGILTMSAVSGALVGVTFLGLLAAAPIGTKAVELVVGSMVSVV